MSILMYHAQFVTVEDVRILRDIERTSLLYFFKPKPIISSPEFYSTQIDEMPVNAAELI